MANEVRLIDANAIEMAMNERYMALVGEYGHYDHYTEGYGDALYAVENAPTLDAVEVVHGRWLKGTKSLCSGSIIAGHCCSVCDEFNVKNSNYCPNCGAKMDGDGNGN